MRKKRIKLLHFTLVLVLLLPLITQIAAAVAIDSPVNVSGMTFSSTNSYSTGNGSVDMTSKTSDTVFTVQLGAESYKTGFIIKEYPEVTTTFTMTNSSSIGVTVTWSGSNVSADKTSGTKLTSGDSITFSVSASGSYWEGWTQYPNKTTGTVNITLAWDKETTTTTFPAVTGGTYTAVDGTGTSATIGSSHTTEDPSYTLSATANSGYRFMWWENTVGTIISRNASCEYVAAAADGSIYPVFVPDSLAMYYIQGNAAEQYAYFDHALSAAGSSGTIVVAASGDMAGSTGQTNFTIPSGVTLLAPYSYDNLTVTTKTETLSASMTGSNYQVSTLEYANNAFITDANLDDTRVDASAEQIAATLLTDSYVNVKLTIPKDITLNIASGGKFIIGGTIISGTAATRGICGATAGAHANVVLDGTLNVNSGGILSVLGYLLGEGTVNVSGTAYQPFTILDGRDGHFVVNSNQADPQQMPFLRYTMQNIQTNIHVTSGGKMMGYAIVFTQTTASILKERFNVSCMDVISSSGLIQLASGATVDLSYNSSEYIDDSTDFIWYDRVGRTTMTINGGATLGNLSLTIKVAGTSYESASKDTVFPVPYNYDISLENGTYNMTYSMMLLPGASMTVDSDAELVVADELIVFDGLFDHSYYGTTVVYGTTYQGHYPFTSQLSSYAGGKTANLVVNGTLTVNSGASLGGLVQTEVAGATIHMNGGTSVSANIGVIGSNYSGVANVQAGRTTRTLTAQVYNLNNTLMSLQSGKNYTGVDARTNSLPNYTYTLYTNGSDTSVSESHTETLQAAVQGAWKCETCSSYNDGEIVAASTCTTAGEIMYTCTVCGHTYTEDIPAAGHTEVTDAAVKASCITTGLTEGTHCAVCGTILAAQEVIPVVKHGTDGCICVARIGDAYYQTLQAAVVDYTSGYIQMIASSAETNCSITKTVYLDLNSFTVSGVTIDADSGGILYGADSSSDGFKTPGGSITVSGSTVAAVANNVNGKDYVAYSADGRTYSFHRFAITPTACQFYLNPNSQHAHLSVMATLQGDSTIFAQNLVKDLGFQINSEAAKWYGGTVSFSGDKTVSYIALTLDGNSSTDYKKAHSITAMAAFDADKTETALVKSNACKITLKTVLDKYISDGGKHAADVQSFLDNLTA